MRENGQDKKDRRIKIGNKIKDERKNIKIAMAVLSALFLIVLATLIVFLFAIPYLGTTSQTSDNKNGNKQQKLITKPDLESFRLESYDDEAQPNLDVPILDDQFSYGVQPIRGVNLGGWLVTEPFITPSLYSNFTLEDNVKDEWSLCKKLEKEDCQRVLKNHYDTFVTEKDFERISGVGLDHVRIPLGYWAIDIAEDEPFIYGSFHYLIKAIGWARKYGIRVMVEFHSAPGSQNGWNHSGKLGEIQFLNKTNDNNVRNIKRFEKIYLDTVKFFSRKEWKNVVTLFGILNEPAITKTSFSYTMDFYKDIYHKTRKELNQYNPILIYHDGFVGLDKFAGKMPREEYNNVVLDIHNYLIFDKNIVRLPREKQLDIPCSVWKPDIAKSMKDFGKTMVGEFSLATNDCGKWLNGIGMGSRYNGTFLLEPGPPICETCTCQGVDDYKNFTKEYKRFLKNFMEKQMDAFEAGIGWFFWNFKTEDHVNPHWDYFLGVEQGWISKDARKRVASCS